MTLDARPAPTPDDPGRLVAEAEDQIEAWLCVLDVAWAQIIDGAHAERARIVDDAQRQAGEIVAQAELESTSLLATAARLAGTQLAESEAEVQRARALAAESSATAATLARAADAAATGRVEVHDLAALGTAVVRLRTELSRVVDAAFDALPAVEATVAALDLGPPVPEPVARPRGLVRRLLRMA